MNIALNHMVLGEQTEMKDRGPNKQKYSNLRREKTEINSKEAITYIVQLLREKYQVFPST